MTTTDIPRVRVLLIEDDPFIRGTIKRMLGTLGSPEVDEAADGEAALQLLAGSVRPELVICDIRMTPMDGLEFLRRLRAMDDSELASVPVLMLTAVADEATVQSTVSLSATGYLLKPVSAKRLGERIAAMFPASGSAAAPARRWGSNGGAA